MARAWVALPDGADLDLLQRRLAQAQETFLATGMPDPEVRQLVVDSWRRSVASGVDAQRLSPVDMVDDVLEDYRRAHPLATSMPMIRRLLIEPASESGLLVAVTDAEGRMLWVEGSRDLKPAADAVNFRVGATWSEAAVGTNGIGTALVLDHAVQIYRNEHFSQLIETFSCTGVPVHDPDTGEILGAVDLTGSDEAVAPRSLALLQATVAAVEMEIRAKRLAARLAGPGRHVRGLTLSSPSVAGRELTLRLEVLGRSHAKVRLGDLETTLSPRHSELLLMLANRPSGVTVEELAVELSEQETNPVTIRAEMSRLRRILGEGAMSSRPYRITVPVSSDVDDMRLRLVRGAVRKAVADYAGPVLPRSQAPGVVELRDDLHQRLRSAVLAHGSLDVLLGFAEAEWGYHDLGAWQGVLAAARAGSPKRSLALARIRTLNATLGDPADATLLQPFRR